MADWTEISDTSLDPDAPLTSELAYAWRDNPIAIAEGAAGAPRISPLAFDGTRILPAISTNGASILNLGDVEILEIFLNYVGGGGSNNMGVRFSTDNGVGWGSYQTFYSSAIETWWRFGRINLVTGDFLIGSTTGTLTVPSDVNAVGFRIVGAGSSYELTPMIGGGRI